MPITKEELAQKIPGLEKPLKKFVSFNVRDSGLVEDMVQDTFLEATKNIHKLQEESKQKEANKASYQLWAHHFVQNHAALTLARLGDATSESMLLKGLDSADSTVRSHSWLSIGVLRLRTKLDALKQRAKKETDSKPKTSAAWALYQLGENDFAFEILEEILFKGDTKNTDKYIYATQIIGSLHNDKSKALLVRLLNYPVIGVKRLAVSISIVTATFGSVERSTPKSLAQGSTVSR